MKIKYYSHLEGCVIYVEVNAKVAHALEMFKKQRKKRINNESNYSFVSLNQIAENGFDIPDEVNLEDMVIVRDKDRRYLESNEYRKFYSRLKKEISSKFNIMSENVRKAMFLRFFKNMSIGQIAQVMNCQRGTAQKYLQRGTRYIRNFLNADIREQDEKELIRALRKAKKY